MAGASIGFKSISNTFDAPDDSSEYSSDSDVEEEEGDVADDSKTEPAATVSDPATEWFNSILLNQPLPPPPPPPSQDAVQATKRAFTAEEAEDPPTKKKRKWWKRNSLFYTNAKGSTGS